MRLLREMRQSLQDGCGCDENAQPYRVHPLRNVHPRLSDERRVLPLRLRQRERNTQRKQRWRKQNEREENYYTGFAVLMVLADERLSGSLRRKDNDKMGI